MLNDMKQIDNRIDLNLLKVFEALHEEGGATRAAVRLGLTQSAVSAALQRLRVMYGDALFTRTGRGLAPTVRAQELRPVIGAALDKCRESLAMGNSAAQRYEGRSVVLGLSDDFEIATARLLIDAVAARAPGLRLAFRQTHSRIVADMLMSRELDLAVASGGFATQWLGHESLAEGNYGCVVDPASMAGPGARLTLDAYVRRDHILISSSGFVGIVDEALAQTGHKRRVVASTTHFAALPFLLRGTDAVATMPAHAAQAIAALTGLRMLPCPLALPRYHIELGWRTDALRDAVIAEVKAVVTEVLSAIRW